MMKNMFLPAVLAVLLLPGCKNPADSGNGDEKNQTPAVYTPGTYSASAEGHGGTLTMGVLFSESAIVEITRGEHQETTTMETVRNAFTRIPKRIVENQSAEVDIVSGATDTSRAIIAAVESCISQAKTGN